MSRVHGLAFEVKGIQPVIAEGGRLRDLAGASELIDRLCRSSGDDLLAEIMTSQSIERERLAFARRAGAAFRVFSADRATLVRLRAAWSLFLGSALPGIEAPSALCSGNDQIEIGRELTGALDAARATPRALLPAVGPFVRRSPRTGRPASGEDPVTGELIDRLTEQKRKVTDKREQAFREGGLVDRLRPGWRDQWLCWPTTFEPEDGQVSFPLLPDNSHIAVLHADGNGLGQLSIGLHHALAEAGVPDPAYARAFSAFSVAIAEATLAAARVATAELVPAARRANGVMPARPILLGGDDLTMIVRGDLAIPFTRTYLRRFEVETKEKLKPLREAGGPLAKWLEGLPGHRLTAGAGIAFIKASQPFHMGLDLAESLAGFAKRVARSVANAPREQDESKEPFTPSVLAFHRVTTTLVDDYETLVERELLMESARRLTLQPYAVHRHDALPSIDALEALTLWLEGGGGDKGSRAGRLREVVGLLQQDEGQALWRYERWRHVIDRRQKGASEDFDRLMTGLGVEKGHGGLHWQKEPPKVGDKGLPPGSPLIDASSWLAVRAGSDALPAVEVAEAVAGADG